MPDETEDQKPSNEMPDAVADALAAAIAPEEAEQPSIEALEAQIVELKDKLLRAVAEAENVRRRAERERQDTAKYAAAKFARDMLEVSDNLRRALGSLTPEEREMVPPSVQSLIEGVEVTERQLLAAFERHGVKEITPQPGEKFDANLHEAMFEVPGTGQPAGSVVQVIEAGYTIGDRLLRAARVGVAAGGNAPGTHVDKTV
jgi:molecular chaperone GrpE